MKAELPSSIIASHWSGVTRYIWDYPLQRAVGWVGPAFLRFLPLNGACDFHRTPLIVWIVDYWGSPFIPWMVWLSFNHLELLLILPPTNFRTKPLFACFISRCIWWSPEVFCFRYSKTRRCWYNIIVSYTSLQLIRFQSEANLSLRSLSFFTAFSFRIFMS